MSVIFSGYSGTVWRSVYLALAQYTVTLSAFSAGASGLNAPTLPDIANASQGMFNSLKNAVEAIDIYALNNAWSIEINALQQIQALPLSLDPTTLGYVNNRITAYESANGAIFSKIPQPPYGTFAQVENGNPIIPSAGMLDFFSTFAFETVPLGLTSDNLLSTAYACANAFLTLANAISSLQGANITQLYDVALREYYCALSAANLIAAFTSGPLASDIATVNSWNQLVALPAMLMCAEVLNGAPYTEQLQQQAVLRYSMLTSADSVSLLMLSLRQPLTSRINLTTLNNDESLMDVAARALGNYELWPEIAALNGLLPPYVGTTKAPGIAIPGAQLILPAPGTSLSALGNNPSYTVNFLGNDLYIGPINGSMPPWTGDFQIIAGYSNLRISLGRRLQTTQGTLIFHPLYGSRIPPEVGAVQTNTTAGHINAFGKSALLADPRVQSVTEARTTLLPAGEVDFVASVQPAGFNTTPIALNEVISPTP